MSDAIDDLLDAMYDRMFTPLSLGVEGWIDKRHPTAFVLAGIRATTPRNPGAVGRYLDGLPTDRPVLVPFVVSDRLAGMLARRGFDGPSDEGHYFRDAS